jgi:tetratricopeptide (TPR) repeat protein
MLKPAPIDEAGIMKLIDEGHLEEAMLQYERAEQEYPGWKVFSEDAMNLKGYAFLQGNKYDMAIAIFKLNAMAYPESGNVWDSLGEAYMNAGNKKEAILNYEKSLAKNPNNANAKNMLAKLKPE